MKRPFLLSAAMVFLGINSFSQNPIVPPGIYIADPSAHAWNDGKLYVYGSWDENPGYYCSKIYKVLSTGDLKTWQLSDTSFASAGKDDQVPYSDSYLYAPDVRYSNGRYYLYYCLASRGEGTEGVAISVRPEGPFRNAKPVNVGGFNEIDPCVFIDDDGQAYMIWGQFNAKMAKMKPDMTEIDTATIIENVVTEKDHFFHEGSYMVRHNGLYYLVYADVSRGGAPTCIGYSVSRSPMGPYKYGGVIIDNKYCDPGVWNNHGSLVEFKGKWYVFYHRSTNNSVTMRKACLEPITFREDGSIPEVQMTSQGAGDPLNAFRKIDAARACMLLGNVRISTITHNNEALTEIHDNDKAFFKYIDFKSGADSVIMKVAPGPGPCRIDLSLDVFTRTGFGGNIVSMVIPEKQSDEWITVRAAIKPTSGVHALRIGFSVPSPGRGSGFSNNNNQEGRQVETELCKLDSFQFK